MNEVKKVLQNILSKLSDEFEFEVFELAGQKIVNISSPDKKLLIGKSGVNLRALEHVLLKILSKSGFEERFILDVDSYKSEKIKEIEEKAILLANRAKTLQYDVEMPPMSAYERLIVHSCLASDPQIKTESKGEGKNRRLIIKFVG